MRFAGEIDALEWMSGSFYQRETGQIAVALLGAGPPGRRLCPNPRRYCGCREFCNEIPEDACQTRSEPAAGRRTAKRDGEAYRLRPPVRGAGLEHTTHCSPCYKEYSEIVRKRKEALTPN
jgi:hypothetical protein